MNNAVDIEFIPDENYPDPYVSIRAKEQTNLVDNIIHAVENVSENQFEKIPAYEREEIKLFSQRDILRAYAYNHKAMIQTEHGSYLVKKTLIALEKKLDSERFIRISHSEIINLYKVKSFEINAKGDITIQFENGAKSWVSRRFLKSIREFLN